MTVMDYVGALMIFMVLPTIALGAYLCDRYEARRRKALRLHEREARLARRIAAQGPFA